MILINTLINFLGEGPKIKVKYTEAEHQLFEILTRESVEGINGIPEPDEKGMQFKCFTPE